jgi:hypothetical protein
VSHHRGNEQRRRNHDALNAIIMFVGAIAIGAGLIVYYVFRLFIRKRIQPTDRQAAES